MKRYGFFLFGSSIDTKPNSNNKLHEKKYIKFVAVIIICRN